MYFFSHDGEHFRDWLDLDWEGVTWQRRFEKEFNSFWKTFYQDGLSIKQLMGRYKIAMKQLKVGPLHSWMNWLKEKNLCYIFIYKNLSLYDLSIQADIQVSELANILRNFFVEKFPHLEDYFNEKFHVGNVISEHLFITFTIFEQELKITKEFKGSTEDEIMTGLEVTLYEQWEKFLRKMKKDFLHRDAYLEKIKDNFSFRQQKRFLQEAIFLFLIGGFLILSLKVVNEWYEERLAEKIRLFEPDFLWTDKSLVFKSTPINPKKIELELKEIEKLKNPKNNTLNFEVEERFEEESDVILTSLEAIPQDFQRADFEKSKYEEILKGGYRDESSGDKKVYRIIMKSIDVSQARQKINLLLKQYGVIQANTVRPGTAVPGGIYFNLFVPKNLGVEFISKVGQVEESSIYISKTRKDAPQGKIKVFIWIKEI